MAVQHLAADEVDTTIHETPGVMGGYPCIGYTRIPVRLIVEAMRQYGVAGAYTYLPQLSRAQVDAALAFYREHPARVDEDIETNDRAYAELVARTPR